MILVDYRCPRCGGQAERLVSSPPPGHLPCPACRAPAVRRFSPVGLLGRAGPAPAPAPGPAAGPDCTAHPDVPALCHLEPSAARAWVARARGDNRALDRELERQERTSREPPATEPVRHDHVHPGR